MPNLGPEALSRREKRNYGVQAALALLAAFALPAVACGNNKTIGSSGPLFTWNNPAGKFRDTVYSYHVIGGRAGSGAAKIPARCRSPKTVRASSSDQRWARRSDRNRVLEIPQAIDSKSSDPARDEPNTDNQNYDDDLQIRSPVEANGASQGFPGNAHRLGTMRDYEDQAKNAPAATVCIASQWWWTSGVAVCKPIAPSSRVTHRGQF